LELAVESSYRGGQPYVILFHGDERTAISSSEAQKLGVAIIEAITITEVEERLALVVAGEKPVGGFGPKAEWEKKFALALFALREQRPPCHPQVSVIYNMAAQKILVEIKVWEQQAHMGVADGRRFANWLLVVAEAAETDAFLDRFLRQEIGISHGGVLGFISQFALFRQQLTLEELLKTDHDL
jgi:hypothetical protein